MKRLGNLFDRFVSMDNLILADKKARMNKKRTPLMDDFDKHREERLLALQKSLIDGTFRTSKYTTFVIHEPKERVIYKLPYYPDRIVQHAIMNVIGVRWLKALTDDQYACIKHRGIHLCKTRVEHSLRSDPKGTMYCLKLDIRHYYLSIDHDIIKSVIRETVKDERFLAVIDEIIDSTDGLPIGNYLSQMLGNLYLAGLAHWLKEKKRVKHLFIYCDDIVVFGETKVELHILFEEIREWLFSYRKLEIKNNWQIFPTDSRGVDFVGYVMRHDYTLIRKSIKQRMARKVGRLRRAGVEGNDFRMAVASWYGWCKHANAINLQRKLSLTQ